MDRVKAILAVYLGGALIGLTLVSFPSSAVFFLERFELSDAQYGSIYLPQLVLAVAGALGGGWAIRFLSLRSMFIAGLVSFLLSQCALAASTLVDQSLALPLIMGATACFGFGFGFAGGPLNGIASVLFPSRPNSGVTLLHMMAGAGLAAGPLLFAEAIEAGYWAAIPLALAVTAAALTVLAAVTRFPEPEGSGATPAASERPSRSPYFWAMMTVAVLYALAEGTFSNWAVVFAQESRGLSPEDAGLALSAFWFALTIGRFGASIVLFWVRPIALWLCLPPLMALAFYLLPLSSGSTEVILGFAFAGFACSAFFPLMVSVTAEAHPTAISFIASMLTAALMVGVGIGSYVIGNVRQVMSLDTLFTYAMAYPLAAFILIILARLTMGRGRKDGEAIAA